LSTLKKTPLTDWHTAHGAKTVDFAGWEMPVQYEGIIAEHVHTRTQASLFDICHMGEFLVSGRGAMAALNRLLTQNLETLPPGKCRYGFMLNESGGVLDDLIAYCLGADSYMLVVNGACEESDYSWIAGHLPTGVKLENVSAATAKIDLQGPSACDALETLLGGSWRQLKYFAFQAATFDGAPLTVSRTGYTGELGYELYLPWGKALTLWEKALAVASVKPAGFGARDTLRLELGYPLYGQDLDPKHTPVEAGYGFLLGEKDFLGKAGLIRVDEKLVALSIEGRRSARHEDKVATMSGKIIGHVTSGSFAPSLGHSVALAYVTAESAEQGAFVVKAARADLPARRVSLPFYDKGTARLKLA
jgi:aminomethyltransferase